MSDYAIFAFGFFVTLLLGAGLSVTVYEMTRMGNRDQNDSYPRVTSSRRNSMTVRKLEEAVR